jgi:hypothetical protein
MAKQKILKYIPTDEETKAMKICVSNDLAYVIQPTKNANRYCVLKFKISNRLELFTYKENDVEIEFTEYDALKKTMELYKLHSKRFTNE